MDPDHHPYRTPPMTGEAIEPTTWWDEETLLYVAIAAIGLLRVVVTLVGGEAFGTEPTIGLLMLGLAAIALVRRRP